MKVLIVEDELKLASLMARGLKCEGIDSIKTDSGNAALTEISRNVFDAIVLDIMIRDLDGLSVLRRIRKNNITTPVIIVTARDMHEEKIQGLNAGADDYLAKPFFVDELVARLNAIWRRTVGRGIEILKTGNLVVNLLSREVKRNETLIDLAAKEFSLLVFLMKSPGRAFNRVQIFESVWSYDFDPETNLVEVYIGRLRKKIDQDFSIKLIETVRGIGYRIRDEK